MKPVDHHQRPLLILFLFIVPLAIGAQGECDKDIEEVLNECTKKHIDETQSFPRTVNDLNVKCLSFKEAGICVKNYAYKCLDDATRIVTGLLISGVRLVGGSFCGSNQDKEEFLTHASCMNATAMREIQCRKNFMQVLRVAKFAKADKKIAISCCYYNEFARCLDSSLIEAGDQCTPKAFDYFREMSNRFRVNTMDLLCGSNYQKHSEKCDDIIGSPITGREVLIKYLVGTFASKLENNV
ncbi:hypothetical protein HDE_10395 [Halotydeus destructor]|nr:hypothetical protein HDE_10395 [Halotydeus destructor]